MRLFDDVYDHRFAQLPSHLTAEGIDGVGISHPIAIIRVADDGLEDPYRAVSISVRITAISICAVFRFIPHHALSAESSDQLLRESAGT